ncbi:MAG: hypothetical protein AB4911_21695 [Oscillochloridaceae bacterium umkhey_bin13]
MMAGDGIAGAGHGIAGADGIAGGGPRDRRGARQLTPTRASATLN